MMLLFHFAKQAQKPLNLSKSAGNIITLFNNLKQSFQLGQSIPFLC